MVNPTHEPVATAPVLATKFFIPRRRAEAVPRPRLLEHLDHGLRSTLILVSAPPGFGKTTLLAEWLATLDDTRPIAWLSLDTSDNDPALFWAYFIAALQRVRPGLGTTALGLLQSAEPQPVESVLTALINDIAQIESDFVLILDDLHVIEDGAIHEGVAFLVDHLPRQMHLVIATRADPPFALARLRARGELTELRAADLRFSSEEAALFLNNVMGLNLRTADVAALETRTEGWAAGLQLAAVSMQGRDDLTGFVNAFAGQSRYIVDYLVEEVLERQPEDLRSFLLRTSILDRLTGPLCDAVTGANDGKAMLEELERRNLFLVSLDDTREWYRYHHLFADVLRAHLSEDEPGMVHLLRGRAAAWYEQRDMPAQAIEQALLAEDSEAVARLLSANYGKFERDGRYLSIARWAASLPEEMVRARPRLALIHAAAALRTDDRNETARRLTTWAEDAIGAIENHGGLNPADDEDGTVIGFDGLEALKGEVLALKLSHSARRLSPEEVARTTTLALQLVPPSNHHVRASLYAIAGNRARLADIASAIPNLEKAVAEARSSQNPAVLARMLSERGQASVAMGLLEEGRHVYEEALEVGEGAAIEASGAMCDLHAWLGEVLLEYGDLSGALNHVAKAVELTNHAPRRSYILVARAAAARAQMRAGDPGAAMEHLEIAQEFVRGSSDSRWVPFLTAVSITLYCAANDLPAAAHLARDRQLTPDGAVNRENAQEMAAYARLLMAQGDHRRAIQVLERVIPVVQAAGRVQDEIQALVLQAMALEWLAERSLALDALARATLLGESGRFKCTFTSEGETMRSLLERLVHEVRQGRDSSNCGSLPYLTYLLREMTPAPTAATARSPHLADDLTPRELEILRLVAAGMQNQEIADHLVISMATVKRHIANTYGKLDVSNRTAAVARASDLSLL